MKTSYRIIKLSSGEELIGDVKGKEGGKIILERPMIFKTQLVMNGLTNSQKEIVFLRDWIAYTNENQAKIQEDHITSIFTPDELVNEMYDNAKTEMDQNPRQPKPFQKPEKNMDQKSVEDMIREMLEMSNEGDPLMDVFDGPDTREESGEDRIYMSMDISMQDMRELLNDGIISPRFFEFMEKMYMGPNGPNREKITDEYTGDDKDHPDYGNRWTDWDSDLSNEDYK